MEKIGKERDIIDKSDETKYRSIRLVEKSDETPEGDGFIVHRSFPSQSIRNLDPFLLLDEMGPLDLLPQEGRGFPDHPHRGFVMLHTCLKENSNTKILREILASLDLVMFSG